MMLSWMRTTLKQNRKTMLITILVLVLIPFLMGLDWTRVADVSMSPTISNNDIVISIDSWGVKEGDIVIFMLPESEKHKYEKEDWIWCKRVDHIKDNKFWLLGDNSEESYDSRHFGYVPWSNIYKKAILIIHK